ncbi:diaminopimelate decarboxylase [Thermosulfurimonas marina]|uniref:Diaminopimelate decarboxylase n=1 Tax=Thermosulfurimonas marina TaxID=2047767 RepID=A0A6H1WU48_9BACT|nr:alanine racemase [Thermosulfurimonas marina]QJA06733.1 diaminopimelate decarboxylase [Thermosulfurimonas marina]
MKKKAYQKPAITKLQVGFLRDKSSTLSSLVRKEIDGVPVKDLLRRYGSPLFVFSEKRLREQIRYARRIFESQYPRVEFSWSYKTNYLDAICRIFHQEGATAEVVSDFEYEKARRLGVPGEKIIFNGPYKPKNILRRAVEEGARINADSLDEILDLEEIASEQGRKLSIGLRINMDTGIYPRWDRFGFNLESGEVLQVAQRIAAGGKLEVVGLHCHQGTFILEPEAYARATEKLLTLARQLEEKFGWNIEYLDLGGGFPSRNRLKGVYLPPEVAVPPLADYAERIGRVLLSRLQPGEYPLLILESGRALVDEAGFLLTTVRAIKRLPTGQRAYVLDAGVNLLFTAFWYSLKVELGDEILGPPEPCVLYGPLCMNIDVVEESILLPPLPRETPLVISPVGAYNITQWMQFITYRPPVVLITEEGHPEIIRKAETLEDIVRLENLPEHLR